MKRTRGTAADRYARSSQLENLPSRGSSMEDNNETPPARKLLKTLLQNEVDKAFHELSEEFPSTSRNKDHRAATLIPEFDPDSEECTVISWLKKIDQLGEIHDWDDKTKSFHLQAKLKGQARKWYNRLDEYDHSWADWKQMLIRAFPKHQDYGNMLEEMLRRKKLPTESMTKYYQDKIAMCFRCKLSDSASVSCIIRGLPQTLQPNARAFQCHRPDELYEGFLCALDDYRTPSIETRGNVKQVDINNKTSKINPDVDPCPRCKNVGHILRNCSQPDLRICFKCGLQGHIATHCRLTSVNLHKPATTTSQNVKEIKLLQNYNDVYKKCAKVNGVYVKSYIDTGSQVNVLNTHIANILNLHVKPTSTALKGFSGGVIVSHGEVEFQLEIDDIFMLCKAYLTEMDMQGINLLIGQPVINNKDVSLIVQNGAATLKYTYNDKEPPTVTEVIEEPEHFKVTTVTKEVLPPGSSIIKVYVQNNKKDNNVVTNSRHFEFQGVSYSLPATLLRGEEGYIKVVNTGSTDVVWERGQVLARAHSCEELPQDSQDGRV